MIQENKNVQLNAESTSIVDNRDLLSKNPRWEKYLRVLIFALYSAFFAIIPSIFIFSNVSLSTQSINLSEIIMIFTVLVLGIFSIYAIYWIFGDSFRRVFWKKYYIIHLINSLLLSLVVIMMSIPLWKLIDPSGLTIEQDILERLQYYLIFLGVWAFSFLASLSYVVLSVRKRFPINFLKFKFITFITFLFFSIAILAFVLANLIVQQGSATNLGLIFEIIIIAIAVLSIILIVFSYIYVKLFKDTILANKTEKEIRQIENTKLLTFLLKSSIFAGLLIFGIALLSKIPSINSSINWISIVEISIDAIFVVGFGTVIFLQKKATLKQKRSTIPFINSLDSILFFKLVTWSIAIKALVLSTVVISSTTNFEQNESIILLLASSASILIILFMCSMFNINFPNIKNLSGLIINLVTFVVLFVSIIIVISWFGTYQFDGNIHFIAVFVLLEVAIGMTVELFVQLFSTKKFFNKDNKIKKESKIQTV
ncbi:MAG: hypothetical protein ACRCRZ_03100 [Metamycoplasmataceae bacterium]